MLSVRHAALQQGVELEQRVRREHERDGCFQPGADFLVRAQALLSNAYCVTDLVYPGERAVQCGGLCFARRGECSPDSLTGVRASLAQVGGDVVPDLFDQLL